MTLVLADGQQRQFLQSISDALYAVGMAEHVLTYWHESCELNLYTLLDHMDSTDLTPQLCIDSLSVRVFPSALARVHYMIPLTLLLKRPAGDIRNQLYDLAVRPSHPLPERAQPNLLPYYNALLKRLPDRCAVVASQHTGGRPCLDRRNPIWQTLWDMDYKYHSHLPILLVGLMFPYGSAVALFIQHVYRDWLTALAGPGLTQRMDQLLQLLTMEWRIDSDVHLAWYILWNRIMDHTASIYYPATGSNTAHFCAMQSQTITCYMRITDRLLCVILLLYHRPYWQELHGIRETLPLCMRLLQERFSSILRTP